MMMGPAPIMRMLFRAVRLGMMRYLFLAGHQADEFVEQHDDVVRARAGFGMALEAEGGTVGELEALQRAVEQRYVRDPRIGRQRGRVDADAVVLAGDEHALGIEVDRKSTRLNSSH